MKLPVNFSTLPKTALAIFFSIAVLASCTKEESTDGNEKGAATITFTASYHNSVKSSSSDVVIESFKINVKEIELEFDDDHPLFASDIELEGPFEVDLMNHGEALVNVIAENVELPAAAYKEIEFEFDKNENPISEMFQKSILVKGTINGTPFIFWEDDSFDVEIEFDYNVYLDEAKQAIITVSFDIASLFDPEMGGVDISLANDGNGNGIIEIYPGDPDGNNDLAGLLMDRLEDIIDAFEEIYDN